MNQSLNKRLQILNDEEIAELYAIPQFTDTERMHYFSSPSELANDLKLNHYNNRNISTKLYFILQYGYFKARHQFYNFSYEVVNKDVGFILEHYMPNGKCPDNLPSRKTQREIKLKLLQFLGYNYDITGTKKNILNKTIALSKITPSPLEIFEEIIKYLEKNKMVIPSYSQLQDTIGAALNLEDKRLMNKVKRHLTKDARRALEELFKTDESFYHITELKFDAKNFQTQELKKEINKLSMCKPVYVFSKSFLSRLELSSRMMNHYSDLAKHYSITQLHRLPKDLANLYLICYVNNRCEKIINNIIQGFIYYVDKYHIEAKEFTKKALPTLETELDEYKICIGKLMETYTNKDIMALSGPEIQKHAFDILSEEMIVTVSQGLLNNDTSKSDKARNLVWEYHRKNYRSILLNLRPLFLSIDFEFDAKLKNLFKASMFLRSLLDNDEKVSSVPIEKIPTAHIKPKSLLLNFMESTKPTGRNGEKQTLNHYQYEFYLYRALRENLKKNKVYVNNSSGYKSFEAEVKIDPDWDKNQEKILANIGNEVLLRPITETLSELEIILEALIHRTNHRIANGDNKYVKVTRHRDGRITWTLPYPKKNNELDNSFYDQLEIKTISEIFDFVEQECHFMKAFKPLKTRGSKNMKDALGSKAAILANGTMQGTHLFSKRSNLKYQRLQLSERNYIRLATLRDAADIIVNATIKLPIFNLYYLNGKKHGSADGTKKKTRRHLLKARYSPKYFGLDIGIVVMTMNLGHIPFSTRIIGANEHESHYIYSMIHQNNSMVDPDIISTDTAGTNNVNDFLYYLINKTHAPCYRSLPEKAKRICGFKSQSHYKDLLIRPSTIVNKKRIKAKWPKLKPILASLLSHETTQENIVKLLSSHEYKNDMKDVLWELNQILKSIHILKYIDDSCYQRDIRMALNRGEAYHQLLSKIMNIGGGDFRGMTELEVEIWNECARLIAVIIIYYNMNLLSKLYEIAKSKNDIAALDYLKHISPVASQHINIDGLYEFSDAMVNIDVESVVERLSKILDETVNPMPVTESTR